MKKNLIVSTAAGKTFETSLITVIDLKTQERFKRTLRTVLPLLGVGFLFLFVPVLHFFVPPGAFLAAIIVFLLRIGEQRLLTAESFSCLHCNHNFAIHQGAQSIEDSFFKCPSCSQRHYIALPRG